jgi:hypothetical protein
MTDNGSKQRPVRTLTVKNFSVIKEAKLEFGKITVLIGPQASGKSLLCKLAYFLGSEVIGIAVESLLERYGWGEFLETATRELNDRFSTSGWLRTTSSARFTSRDYAAEAIGVGDILQPKLEIRFSAIVEDLYRKILDNPSKRTSARGGSRTDLRNDLWIELSLLLDRSHTEENLYIPSGRGLFTDPSKAIAALQNPEIDHVTRHFSGLTAWDSKWKAGLLTLGREVVRTVESEMQRIVGGFVSMSDGRPVFIASDGRVLPLSMLSSGTLELLPMFNVLNRIAYEQEHRSARFSSIRIPPIADISHHNPRVYLEEPEAEIFPATQYDLVRIIAFLANDSELDFHWVITTHSPYILSSFNNLLQAWQVGTAGSSATRKEVAAIIDERYWVDPAGFRAHSIHDGKLESIMDDETYLINGAYLDGVSNEIGSQFDELLRIGYVKS